MKAEDIFAGPIIRRAEPRMVAIWLATKKDFNFNFTIRVNDPNNADTNWIGHTQYLSKVQLFPKLYIYLAIILPEKGKLFPDNRLLEYSISVVDADGKDNYSFFEKIVKEDQLSYPDFKLPNFYLQARNQRLSALYASCRKIHDIQGDDNDALSFGDNLIYNNKKVLGVRPAILCLTGDQIYADDVHDATLDEITKLSAFIADGKREILPSGLSIPAKGRQSFLEQNAGFTSNITYPFGHKVENHLITLDEYVAMYGLAWNKRNWSQNSLPKDIASFVESLSKVRRLMANTPTYMIFDDHDVTDDWNLDLQWTINVYARYLGRRVVTNALFAYWLFQAWGNDPSKYNELFTEIINLNHNRQNNLDKLDSLFWSIKSWEFATPTYPFIYFLDTRTQRGPSDLNTLSNRAPAYLKNLQSWKVTLTEIQKNLDKQSSQYPLVLVAPGPVFGFEYIDILQKKASEISTQYTFDQEAWSTNTQNLLLLLRACSNLDVVLISGDVHYSYTSTAKFSNFDDETMRWFVQKFPNWKFPKLGSGASPTYQFLYSSRYIQLTSSGARNFGNGLLENNAFGSMSSFIVNHKGNVKKGTYYNGELKVVKKSSTHDDPNPEPEVVKPEDYKIASALFQRINEPFNNKYIRFHNIGNVYLDKKHVENFFIVKGKRTLPKIWNFTDDRYWKEH